MSLLRPVVRSCVVGALRDKTWAESRVYDTDMTPLAEAVYGQAAKPYIVVFTDTDDINPVKGVAEIYDGDNRQLSIIIEIGVASSVKNTQGNIVIQFSHTDFGMEWAVDVISGQVLSALIGDPTSEWGTLFKRLVYKMKTLRSRRGGQTSGGIRFAARRLTLVYNTNHDVAPGVVVESSHPIRKFIEMARDSKYAALGLTEQAEAVEKLLAISAAPTWRQAQALLGITGKMARQLMVPGTPLPIPNIETPPLDWSDKNEFVPAMTDIRIATPEEYDDDGSG